jgi:CxxC-x17-CxxC domain-containing protein
MFIRRNGGKTVRDFNNRGGGNFNRSFGPREMHKAVCSDCGSECEVPFKPTEGKPVYCKECYKKKKGF